jgi:hypothetical protein
MADTFAKIEARIRRKSRQSYLTNVLLAAILVAVAYILYRYLS